MKKLSIITLMLLLNSLSLFANESNDHIQINPDDVEITESSDEHEETRLTIKEIKTYLKTTDKQNTCLDEYLKRRTQLITKLALTPVTSVAIGVGSVYVGAGVGIGAAAITNTRGWSALGYMIIGAGSGVVLTTAYTLYDTTKSTMEILDNNLMIKALAEQYMNADGPKSDKLYKKYTKKNASALSRDAFFERLIELDQSGALCNGSMTKKSKIKLGFDLKYKLVKSKDLAKKI